MTAENYIAFWGKARAQPDGPQNHPLAYHSLDVAAVADALFERDLARPPPTWDSTGARRAVVALMALHDIGKFSRPFQAKAPDVWPLLLGPLGREMSDPGHGSTGLNLLDGTLRPMIGSLFEGWSDEASRVLGAVCGHHGRPVDGNAGRVSPKIVCPVCLDAAGAFARDVIALLDPPPLPSPERDLDPAISWWLAGLATLADWIGSSQVWFGYTAPEHTLATYWPLAQQRAAHAVEAAGILRAPISPHVALADLVGASVSAPSPVQALAASMPLGAEGPTLTLIEDQTGSGKTEAALLVAHRLMADGRADGVFVALPTMATANAMYDRLAAAYRRLFAADAAPSLVLAHGGRRMHDGFQDSILRAEADDRAATEDGAAQCAAWIGDDRRRSFLAHVGVGTIDQALLAVLPTRFAAMRLFGLRRRVLLIDEAHAYDTYMRREMLRLITFQAGLGGSVIVLSATLPMALRRTVVNAFACSRGEALGDESYPLVTTVRDGAAAEQPCAGRNGLARRVLVERLADPAAAVERIAAAAGAGQAVAWVRNSVADAAEAHGLLVAAGVRATLFHARFTVGDRAAIERDVMRQFGRDSADRAGVVVATQVIEQSLDLDFDVMVSDLAPLDLLIQRAGRVWRHERTGNKRGGCDAPRLLVVSPEPVAAPGPGWLGPALRRTGVVYADHALLWRSARTLFAAGGIEAPGDVRRLVEAAYDEANVPEGLTRASDRADGRARAAGSVAEQNLLDWQEGYSTGSGLWLSDDRMPTRLGDESLRFRVARWDGVTLRPWHDDADPARAWVLSELALPPWVATGVPAKTGALATAIDGLRATWVRWEQDIPVLPLCADAAAWVGTIVLGKHDRSVRYAARNGLSGADTNLS